MRVAVSQLAELLTAANAGVHHYHDHQYDQAQEVQLLCWCAVDVVLSQQAHGVSHTNHVRRNPRHCELQPYAQTL